MRSLPLLQAQVPSSGAGAFGAARSATHVHRGSDFSRPEGTRVCAAADGVVDHASSQWQQGFSGYGGHVVLRHGQHWTLYAHLRSVAVSPGERVLAGDAVGSVGRTSFTREDHDALLGSPHLHFEVSPAKYPQQSEAARLDPAEWLRGAVDPRIADALAMAARESSVELALLRAVAYAASKWNPAARAGERVGLFGLPESSLGALGVSVPLDPLQNARGAARLLSKLLERFKEPADAIAAFAWSAEQVEYASRTSWPSSVAHFVTAALERYALEQREVAAIGRPPIPLAAGARANGAR